MMMSTTLQWTGDYETFKGGRAQCPTPSDHRTRTEHLIAQGLNPLFAALVASEPHDCQR